jgi:hypothetical protein
MEVFLPDIICIHEQESQHCPLINLLQYPSDYHEAGSGHP